MSMNPEQRRFGVELECIPPNGDCYSPQAEWWADRFFNQYFSDGWAWCYDGGGIEFKTPPLTQATGFRKLKSAMDWLKDAGFYAATTAGMHVHIEADDLTVPEVKRVIRSWAANQHHIDQLVDDSRVGNGYCEAWGENYLRVLRRVPNDIDAAWAAYERRTGRGSRWDYYGDEPITWGYFDRFLTCAPCALESHGTIEFRQHHSTVDYPEAEAWVMFLLGFVNDCAARKTPMKSYQKAERLIRRTVPVKMAEDNLFGKLARKRAGERLITLGGPSAPPEDDDYDFDEDDDIFDDDAGYVEDAACNCYACRRRRIDNGF